MAEPLCLCDIVDRDATVTQKPDEEKLDDRWKSLPVANKKQKRNEPVHTRKRRKEVAEKRENLKKFYPGDDSEPESDVEAVSLYLPGQSRILKSPAEMTQDLLVRDVENLANFDGIRPAGATIVPKTYVPKNPRVVQPEKGAEALGHCQHDEKLRGEIINAKGELAEKKVYYTVKRYYDSNPDRTALIIRDLQMLQPNLEKRRNKDQQELDLIIIDYNSKTVYVIEVKRTLNEISMNKVREQLPDYKDFFDEWFGSDVCQEWKFKSFAFCLEVQPGFEICKHCRDLILIGEDELTKAFEKGNQTIPQPSNGEFWTNPKLYQQLCLLSTFT
jgi:hypothetical protein